ncbi:MAG: DUF4256 domain-containing protein [Bacteroidetes bacterium]|nr:DUF4256 domain-containing protein [Bacteroidota bacterium]
MKTEQPNELLGILHTRFESNTHRHPKLAWEDVQARLEANPKKLQALHAMPEDVRSLGGALFCDRRYGRVFTYHNGAESYYAARGFRAKLRI